MCTPLNTKKTQKELHFSCFIPKSKTMREQ